MTNGNNFPDQNRVNRANYEGDRQRTDRMVDQVTSVEYDENGVPIATQNVTTRDSVNARPATRDEVSYRNGYVEGQNQQRVHEDIQRTRAENSAATGTLIGILIASIAGLVLAALYFLPQNRQPQVTPAPAASPAQPQNTTQPQGANRTTIIERVREVPAAPQNTEIIVTPSSPQPVQPAPTQSAPTQPDLTQPDTSASEPVTPLDSSVTDPVDPAIPADPNQSLSQPDTTSDGTTTGQ
jgi:hypothetical protein